MSEKVFIGGKWCPSNSGKLLELLDPSTGEKLANIARGDEVDIDLAVGAARKSLSGEWGKMSAVERGRVLSRMGKIVEGQVEQLAKLEAQDVGKPLKQARADAVAMARYFEYYGGAADKMHGQTIPFQQGYTVYTLRESLGVTGHIIPWNYPMQIIGRSVGAALAMGNACVLKPAEEACLTALALGDIANEAGLPAGALNIVPGLGAEAGAALSGHGDVDHLSFTGSVSVGAMVQQAAGANVRPVTLELGGKSPQLVFADADLGEALPFLVGPGVQNAGQTCSAASRILVQAEIFEEVLAKMAGAYRALRVGAGVDDLDVGPLVSARQREIVEGFLTQAKVDGLRIVAQGKIDPDAPEGGFYVRPTLVAGLDETNVLAREETFGPVQVVIPFKDEADAVRIANSTEFGLVASVWTRDGSRSMRLAKSLRAGQVFINNYGAGGGVELPFGGVKNSGHGREKGFEALYGFSSLKTVAVKHG